MQIPRNFLAIRYQAMISDNNRNNRAANCNILMYNDQLRKMILCLGDDEIQKDN